MKSLTRTKEASEQTLSKGKAGAEVGSKVKAIGQSGSGVAVTGFRSQNSSDTESHQLSLVRVHVSKVCLQKFQSDVKSKCGNRSIYSGVKRAL